MVETRWENLRGRELRYLDHTWKLTGNVDIRKSGELLAVEATQSDDVRHRRATLYFGVRGADSLNPKEVGDHFDRLERTDDGQHLVVKREGRTYRYELQRLEYE